MNTTHHAREIDGQPAPFWLAYYCSHRWGGALEDSREDHETLIDADTDPHALRERVNTHYALPQVLNVNRNNRHFIPPFKMKSERMFGAGGGCDYHAWVELRPAPRVTTKACDKCAGLGMLPNPDPKKARNHYFNVRCEKCNGAGTV